VGLFAAASLAASCGSVEPQVAGESSSAETARFEMVMTRTDMSGRIVLTGLADYGRRIGMFRTAMLEGADTGESYNGNATQGDEVRIFGDASYVQWTVKDDRTYWVEEMEEFGGYPTEAIVSFPGTDLDPAEAYSLIVSAGRGRETLGEEVVRGQVTTHYRMDVDPELLAKRIEGLDLSDPIGKKPFAIDLWADADQRVRRLRIREEMDQGEFATMTHEFFDFGVRVEVERPTEDVISAERLDELTTPSDTEMRELCEEEIPKEVCAEAEKEGE
jgi:hypothetical protein